MNIGRKQVGNCPPAPQGPWILVALALFLTGLLLGQTWREPLASSTTAAEMPTAVAVFGEAWTLLHEHYVEPTALDDKQLLAGALRGLADAVGDSGHTRYLTAEELSQHSEQLSGEYTGIGVEIEDREGKIIVRDVFEESPAQRKPGYRSAICSWLSTVFRSTNWDSTESFSTCGVRKEPR